MTSSEHPPDTCPLCTTGGARFFHRDRRREYLRCDDCGLVFVPPRYFLTPAAEKAYYDLHQNSPDDAGYRRFLGRLFHSLNEKLSPGARGLDFGSGPGPTLSLMLAEAGFPTTIYDPFYAPDAAVWHCRYDFVTASEVVEHLHRPMTELQRLWSVLRPGGWLAIMTKRALNQTAFATWHYREDPTHVAFFAEETFGWLARQWSAELQIAGPDVVLLRKPEDPPGSRAECPVRARFSSCPTSRSEFLTPSVLSDRRGMQTAGLTRVRSDRRVVCLNGTRCYDSHMLPDMSPPPAVNAPAPIPGGLLPHACRAGLFAAALHPHAHRARANRRPLTSPHMPRSSPP